MYTVSNGLRVHHQLVQNLPGPHPLSTQHHPILAASLILDMSVKVRSVCVCVLVCFCSFAEIRYVEIDVSWICRGYV